MAPETLRDLVLAALDDVKGQDILALDVSGASSFTDWMVIASGTSNRHVKALVDNVVDEVKARGIQPLGLEGQQGMEWILVDLGDVVVHVMQTESRSFYDLERLWKLPAAAAGSDRSLALAPAH